MCNGLWPRFVGLEFFYWGVYIAKHVFIGSLYSKSHQEVQTWTKFSTLFIFLLYTPQTRVFNSGSHYQLSQTEMWKFQIRKMKTRRLMIIWVFPMMCQKQLILKILTVIVKKKYLILIIVIQEIERILITNQSIF